MAKPKTTRAPKREGKGDTLHEPPMADVEREAKQRELEAQADALLRGGKPAEAVDADGVIGGVTHLKPGEKASTKRGTSRKVGDKVPTVATQVKRHFERMLPVKLNALELRERSVGLANSVDQIAAVEARKKVANDGFKSELEQWKGVQGDLSRQVESGEQLRQVKCREVHDYVHKVVLEYRDDSNVVLSQREMNEHEMQLGLSLEIAN